jgi:putative two-component system response regulator
MLNAVRKGVDHCRLKRFEQDHRKILEQEVADRTRELARTNEFLRKVQASSIFALAKLAESRDDETGNHLKRLQAYCRVLCHELARRKQFRPFMTERFIEDLVQCSVLHDVGKVGIPDSILFNPRKFGIDEFEIMKQHAIFGGRALEEAAREIGDVQSYLSLGKDVAYYHHEHWDGSGYPFGLKGEEIPLAARIVAIADVYDALTTERRYKTAFSHSEAVRMITGLKGKQFDPDMVDAFIAVKEEFRRIRDGYGFAGRGSENP